MSISPFELREVIALDHGDMAQLGKICRASRWSLKGMTALVAGGTKGIGYELAGLGAAIHKCSWSEAELNSCSRDWEQKGLCVTGSVYDIFSRSQRESLMNTFYTAFDGKLVILVSAFPH
ncbi:hypothetical protein LguiB_000764 [Lonicera macranthoides]